MSMRIDRHDSPLGRWLQARWSPPRLAGLVDEIWYFEGDLEPMRERHFPDGRIELVAQLEGEPYRHVVGDETPAFAPCCLSGILLGPDVIEPPAGRSAVLGIRLRPAGAYAVLGRPLHDLTDRTVDLGDVVGMAATELAERCHRAPTAEGRLRAAGAWVGERLGAHVPIDPAIGWVADRLERSAGSTPIGALREEIGWSKARFAHTFREQIGVTPKLLGRLLRFRTALDRVLANDLPLAEIALATGYYDQSHFGHEFRQLSGFTPTDYRACRRYPDSPNLAETAP